MLPFRGVCLSVCLSRSCIVLKRQKISIRILLRKKTRCLSQIAIILFRLTLVNPFLPKVTHPPLVDVNVGEIRWQTVAKCLEIVQSLQWRAYWKSPSLFAMITSLSPYNLHFPENGDPVMLPLSNYIGPMTTCMTKIKCTDLKQRYTCTQSWTARNWIS